MSGLNQSAMAQGDELGGSNVNTEEDISAGSKAMRSSGELFNNDHIILSAFLIVLNDEDSSSENRRILCKAQPKVLGGDFKFEASY
jgi:hypothetical protein